MNAPATIKARRCPCGSGDLKVVANQVAEDCVETFLECNACGRSGEAFEYPYRNAQGAADLWNAGRFELRP